MRALPRILLPGSQKAAVAQLVERNLAKVEVESSRLFCRSSFRYAFLAQLVERRPYKANVGGSTPSGRTKALVVKLVDTLS